MNDLEETYRFVADDWPVLLYDLVTCKNRNELLKLYTFSTFDAEGEILTGKMLQRWHLLSEMKAKLSSGFDPRIGLSTTTDPYTKQDFLQIPTKIPENYIRLYYLLHSRDRSSEHTTQNPTNDEIMVDETVYEGKPFRRGYFRTARNTIRKTLQRAYQSTLKSMNLSLTGKKRKAMMDENENSDNHECFHGGTTIDQPVISSTASNYSDPIDQAASVVSSPVLQYPNHITKNFSREESHLSQYTTQNFQNFKSWVTGTVSLHVRILAKYNDI